MYLRDMLDEDSVKPDNHVRLKIIRQMEEARYKYGELLHKGPIVWSIDKVLKKKTIEPIPTPQMESIWGES